jgi:hypothetical protein
MIRLVHDKKDSIKVSLGWSSRIRLPYDPKKKDFKEEENPLEVLEKGKTFGTGDMMN